MGHESSYLLLLLPALWMTCKKKVNDNFSPLRPGHASSIDMTCKKKVNNNFSPTLNSTRLPELGHKSSIDIIYKNEFFPTLKPKGQKCETDNFSPTLKSSRPLRLGH